MSRPLDRFKNVFNQLDKNHLDLLEQIYTPDVKFRDPVQSLNGLPTLRDYYSRLYEGVLSCQFTFEAEVIEGQQGMLAWIMRFQHRRFRAGETLELNGVSHLQFLDDGRFTITATISTWANSSTSGSRCWAASSAPLRTVCDQGKSDMKIAIIGTGISGLTAAWQLHREHHLTLFEANDYIGGHTHTVDVAVGGRSYAVDTGFIVFNDWTYPNFINLLESLGMASQPTLMSFSVRCERTGLEYNGENLNTLFAQRRNLFCPSFHRMIRDTLRFNREAPALLDSSRAITLNAYLREQNYSQEFTEHYILPMAAAIWSAEPDVTGEMPVRFFVPFFKNHGLLNVKNRPQWRVIQGGSRSYVERLTAPFRDRIRLNCPVEWVRRHPQPVHIKPKHGPVEFFDEVIFATHSDQALRLLADPTAQEREILSAIPYQSNEAVLGNSQKIFPQILLDSPSKYAHSNKLILYYQWFGQFWFSASWTKGPSGS